MEELVEDLTQEEIPLKRSGAFELEAFKTCYYIKHKPDTIAKKEHYRETIIRRDENSVAQYLNKKSQVQKKNKQFNQTSVLNITQRLN